MLVGGAANTIQQFVDVVFYIYLLLILIHILLSWFQLPYNRWLNVFRGFLHDVVAPYLGIFRRFLPVARVGGLGLDLSPILGIIVLVVAQRLVRAALGSLD